MSDTRIDAFWRPPYELASATAWFIGSISAFVYGRINDDGFRLLALSAIPLLFFAVLRFRQALANLNFKYDLLVRKPLNMSADDVLAKQAQTNNEKVWIGRGFAWQPSDAQKLYDALQQPPQSFKLPDLYVAVRRALKHPLPPEVTPTKAEAGLYAHGVGAQREEDLFLPVELLSQQMYVVATTGAGKTRTLQLLALQAYKRGEAVIIFDPKGDRDLRNLVYSECVKDGCAYKFHLFKPSKPQCSVAINPMTNFSRETQIPSRVVTTVPGTGNAASFKAFAWRAVNVVVEALLYISEELSLVRFLKYVTGDFARLTIKVGDVYFKAHASKFPNLRFELNARCNGKKDIESVAKAYADVYDELCAEKYPDPTFQKVIDSFRHPKEHYSKVITNLLPEIEKLTSGSLGKLLSPTRDDPEFSNLQVDMASIVEAGHVLYIDTESLADPVVSASMASLLISDLTSVAFNSYNRRDPKPVTVIYDEAGETISEGLIQQLNKSRGARFRVVVCTQTMSDITVKLGSEDATMQTIGNANTTIALRVKDPKTAEWISDHSGVTNIHYVTTSTSTTPNSQAVDVDFVSGYGTSLAYKEAPLITKDALLSLPDLEFFAILPGRKCIKGIIPFVKPEYELDEDKSRAPEIAASLFEAIMCHDEPISDPTMSDISKAA